MLLNIYSGVAVVQFNTRWSERCRQMSTYVEQLCKLNPSINFLKVSTQPLLILKLCHVL